MKLHLNKIYSSLFLLALTGSTFANHHAATTSNNLVLPGKFYAGVFGGGGASDQTQISQFGTAFYAPRVGGPLAVNAFGHTNNPSIWLAGAQVGYQARELSLASDWQWTLTPAAELEGYYVGKKTFSGNLTNNTSRLPEHDFVVTYPMKTGVFLANAVLNLNIPCWLFHPYLGVGFGGAIVKISDADASQVAPAEPGVNHYNANTTDTSPTVATQVKAGVSYDINECVSLFAEYRWLYLSNTHFAFGSTVYPTHVATSNWQVKFGSQNYNMGTVGVRLNL